jgi:5'-3' exonuclease
MVDGNNLAFRNWSAVFLTNSRHENVGAIYGSLTSIRTLVKKYRPGRIVVCWDHGESQWRKKMYPEYKQKREELKGWEDYVKQKDLLMEVLNYLPVVQIRVKGVEADDLVGILTYAMTGRDQIGLVSSDKDFYQLLDSSVFLIRKTKNGYEEYAWQEFVDEFGLLPTDWLDMKAMMGDPGDNIPGVRGIGEKKAAGLLKLYGRLDAVLDMEISPLSRDVLLVRNSRDVLRISKKLSWIPRAIDQDLYSVEQAREIFDGVVRTEEAMERTMDLPGFVRFCEQCELKTILKNGKEWFEDFKLGARA